MGWVGAAFNVDQETCRACKEVFHSSKDARMHNFFLFFCFSLVLLFFPFLVVVCVGVCACVCTSIDKSTERSRYDLLR